jgi:hypothetical protein
MLVIFHSFLQISFAELYVEHMLYWLYFYIRSGQWAVMGRNTSKCISNKDTDTDTSKYFK